MNLNQQSISNYQRILASSIAVMEKGASYFNEQGIDPNQMIEMRLADDMAAFPFQVNSVMHHSLGAAKGLLKGEFGPPPATPELDYQGLIHFLSEALTELNTIDVDAVEAIADKPMVFRMGDFEMPFTAVNFIHSFSLPNLYFHATTMYDMLRIKGVPLSKMDFLGNMSMGLPDA